MRWTLLAVAVTFSTVVSGEAPVGTAAPVRCTIGPLTKTIGGNPWPVYACSDGKSIAVVSTPEAKPTWFYYVLAPSGHGYAVSGEVNGDKSLTKPVFDELSAMNADAVAELYHEVQESVKAAAEKEKASEDTPDRPRD